MKRSGQGGFVSILNSRLNAVDYDSDAYSKILYDIKAYKEDVIAGRSGLRIDAPVETEVAASWIASRENGVDFYATKLGRVIPADELVALREHNADLLRVVESNLARYEHLIKRMTCCAFFTDPNGVLLYKVDGNVRNEHFESLELRLGMKWTEEDPGTTCAVLSNKHRTTVQLVGPEHYCLLLQDHITVATPVHDEDGAFLGTVSLASLIVPDNERNMPFAQPLLLGWALSLGAAVENELKLSRVHERFNSRKIMGFSVASGNGFKSQSACDKRGITEEGAFAARTFDQLVGASPALKKAVTAAQYAAAMNANILLSGESGTGKRSFASAMHCHCRPEGPFVTVNFASIPRDLVEAELLGYEDGVYDGVQRIGRPGKIEQAQGGTLFLDDIGNISFKMQSILLRIIGEKRLIRVGGMEERPVDFLLIAASSQNMQNLVEEGRLREDFYYRLAGFTVSLPPLRERGDDVIGLARHFIEDLCARMGTPVPELSEGTIKALSRFDWPGNVQQLKNAVEYAVCMAQDGMVKMSDLPLDVLKSRHVSVIGRDGDDAALPATFGELECPAPLEKIEREAIRETLVYVHGNVSMAAKLLGVGRSTLYRKIAEYGLADDDRA